MRNKFHTTLLAVSATSLAATTFLAVPGRAMAAGGDGLTTVEMAASSAVADLAAAGSAPAIAHAQAPARAVSLSVGTGQLIVLPRAISGVFVADEKVADVNVKSATQLYLFGKTAGQTSVYATDKSGAVVWSSQVRVGANIADVAQMLRTVMPENDVHATNLPGMVILTGTVLAPKDADEAQRLTEAFTGNTVTVVNRLKVATPEQVSLHVKIAEVSRSISRQIGINVTSFDATGGFKFGVVQGRAFSPNYAPRGGLFTGGTDSSAGTSLITALGSGTSIGLAGKLLGVDVLSALDLAETTGLVTTLAEPNLVALSGETASFLAGGEIPIPQSSGLGTVSVEFKQYGVSLSFTPTVLSAGRISLRVRPEVSQLSDQGSVKLNGFTIPALTTRRADTTVELGSGQSFVIGGLLQNSHNNSVDKAPFLGDLPILGALFRSNGFKKEETELMIVVTPYIVKPIDANRVALPTDGYRSALPVDRILSDRQTDGRSGAERPKPKVAPSPAPAPTTSPAASH